MRNKKYSYYLQVILVASLLLTAFTSCQFDELTDDCDKKGLIVLTLGIDGMSTRAAGDQLFTGDEAITKVRVFVFVGDALELNMLYSIDDAQFNNPFVMEVATGRKDIYVVTNESDALGIMLNSVYTKVGLSSVMADEINSQLVLPLVMTGSQLNVDVTEQVAPDTHNSVSITLSRIASKVSLSLKKDNDYDVSITKVSLINNTGKTAIWEGGVIINNQSYWDFGYTPATAINLTDELQSISTVYLYENLAGSINNGATRLELEALYNNVPTKYWVYVNENVSSSGVSGDPSSSVANPSDHLYSVKRNHKYQLNGTIKDIGEFDGLLLSTNVLPWNHLPASYSFEHTYTINPQPTESAYTYTLGANGQITFTFKLTNPIDASWVANLTNPTGFEFVGVSQGVTDQEVTLTIKATHPAGAYERTTELYINVIYGSSIAEVPLVTGAQNRIVIKQPANP